MGRKEGERGRNGVVINNVHGLHSAPPGPGYIFFGVIEE
jgi:hypothetical protein